MKIQCCKNIRASVAVITLVLLIVFLISPGVAITADTVDVSPLNHNKYSQLGLSSSNSSVSLSPQSLERNYYQQKHHIRRHLEEVEAALPERKRLVCKDLWRPDELIGKCFGLRESTKFNIEGFRKKTIETEDDCRKLCCFLGDQCVTWQFQVEAKRCLMGPVVRFGLEHCNGKIFGNICGNWCEPNAPVRWNGRKLVSKDSSGQCIWGDELPTQCFGYGPEKFKLVDGKKERRNLEECQQACCDDKKCNSYQEAPGRGCYYGKLGNCEKYSGQYVGARKCIQGHCGGMEDQILVPWQLKYNSSSSSSKRIH